jgi:dihydrofolate reductase
MPKVVVEISTSLDGFVAGPNPTLEEPLGQGGERLHEWTVRLASWRERHGLEGGETGPEDDFTREGLGPTGAVVMGRRMFSGGSGPWGQDPNPNGWWGDDPPFGVPVFVLTHYEREPLVLGDTTFTFVGDGIEAAVERGRAAAGDRVVLVAGGAQAAQQAVHAGLVSEILIHVAPVLLGGGTRLFANGERPERELEIVRVFDSPHATHLHYRLHS